MTNTDPRTLSLSNRFAAFSAQDKDDTAKDSALWIEQEPQTQTPQEPSRTIHTAPARRPQTVVKDSGAQMDCETWKPYNTCYFLPGKVQGKPVRFLIDTGCTTNLLAKHVFDRLPPSSRQTLRPYTDSHGTMADGSTLPFYGVIELPCRIRDVMVTETFIVSKLGDDAILGMPFLVTNECSMEFGRPILKLKDRSLACIDRQGNALVSSVQVVRPVTIPAATEMMVMCRITQQQAAKTGMIEGTQDDLPVAASLNRPDDQGRLFIRCMNTKNTPHQLTAGTVVANYTSTQDAEVSSTLAPTTPFATHPANQVSPSEHHNGSGVVKSTVPTHVQDLLTQSQECCNQPEQQQIIAQLLREYQDVFSRGDQDMGLTTLTEHDIPVIAGTRPLRQPARRLGWEKEAEVERQVEDLLQRGLIEPASGAWSSPVVLVKKKDGRILHRLPTSECSHDPRRLSFT